MKNRHKKNKINHAVSLVSLGLAGLLPSSAFAKESIDYLNQALTSQDSSKVFSLGNHSSTVDLRSAKAKTYDQTLDKLSGNQSFVFDKSQSVLIKASSNITDQYLYFTANNGSEVNLDFKINSPVVSSYLDNVAVLIGNWLSARFEGNGKFNILVDNSSSTHQGNYAFIDFCDANWGGYSDNLFVSSSLTFKVKGKLESFMRISYGGHGDGRYVINSPYLEVDMHSNNTYGASKYFIKNEAYSTPSIFLNAKIDNPNEAHNINNVSRITGDILVGQSLFYAHFTNAQSFLKGNLIFNSLNSRANIVFTRGSSMTGDIDVKGDGNHNITFDQASFIGSVKSSTSMNQGAWGVNTTVDFKNTAGKTFGNGSAHIVDTTFKGTTIGRFDVSANSTTKIKGGDDGSKGFFGSEKNNLTFDFRNNAKTNSTQKFTIGGGNAQSIYVMQSFASNLDLSDLQATADNPNANQRNTTKTIASIIDDAGIKLQFNEQATSGQDQSSNNTPPSLGGTLLFTRSNIIVGSPSEPSTNTNNGDNALFAKTENIVGAGKALNGLAVGAMFGNASWNDVNNDGSITENEISAYSGNTVYKLTPKTQKESSETTDSRTSTGNIGNTGDNVKKHIGFIFANGVGDNLGYVFNGDKQGYSGTIQGGTADSKYYFANAGYVNRQQIEDSLGELVLFNTAFRGDLGVKNKNVNIMLDFSDNRNGLRSETGDGNSNIVGSGSKNIVFNFTGNTQQEKYKGAVVGDATKANTPTRADTQADSTSTDNDTATYTMLNLKKYSANDQLDGNGALKIVSQQRGGGGSTLITAIQSAGLTNFNKQDAEQLKNYQISSSDQAQSGQQSGNGKDTTTNVELFSTANTTLSLRGTSLDATGATADSFKDYKYDLAFGTGLGSLNGVAIQDSKVKGVIDLTGNNNLGHKIVMRGDSIDGEVEIKFKENNFTDSNGGFFSYSDSTSTDNTPKTLKLTTKMTNSNYLKSGDLVFANTNLEVDSLYASENVNVNLDFRENRTLKVTSGMGFKLRSGSNLIVHGSVVQTDGATPTIQIATQQNQGKIELINTGANLVWNLWGVASWNNRLGQSFDLRGTGLKITYNSGGNGGGVNRFHGSVDSGYFNAVFAKGSNIDTTLKSSSNDSTYLKITDKDSNNERTGKYENGIYDGNYIAQSQGEFSGVNINSGFNFTFVGEKSWKFNNLTAQNFWAKDSSLTFINASDANGTDGETNPQYLMNKLGVFTQRGDFGSKLVMNIEGTTLHGGGQGDELVKRTSNQDKLTFKITFIDEGSNEENKDKAYVGDKYADLATTKANGALQDSILKVKESKLISGVNFKDTNAFITFVGDGSQELDGQVTTTNGDKTKILKGGSASSIVTFRDSNLNAGNATSSSIQNVKGTIAFDLSHNAEDMQISGTLKNMFANGSNTYNGTGKYQTKFSDCVSFNHLVFISSDESSTKLGSLGKEFNDVEVFGNALSARDYSELNALTTLKSGSSLTLAGGSTVALSGANQEVFFIGANSHGFGKTDVVRQNDRAGEVTATTLGDSSGSTLTFIDAGELKVANIQNGKGTINLIGKSSIELQNVTSTLTSQARGTQLANTEVKTLTLYKAGTTATDIPTEEGQVSRNTNPITGEGLTINAVFTGSNVLGTGVKAKGENGTADADDISSNVASNTNIGQKGEKTTYHLLFDYTDTLKDKAGENGRSHGYGKYWMYQGTISGLTSDSIIKFKNSGYINESQITDTDAKIIFDNTKYKGDFRQDVAVLDLRNNQPMFDPNTSILTSDKTTNKLSRKILTFDFTGTSNIGNAFTGIIQAGYKVAPSYTNNEQSHLTFLNISQGLNTATTEKVNSSTASKSSMLGALLSAGMNGLSSVELDEPADGNLQENDKTKTYILKGTKLEFKGTNISGDITENNYDLALTFDQRADGQREQTDLDGEVKRSSLSSSRITMGSIADTTSGAHREAPTEESTTPAFAKGPRNLSLTFYNADSISSTNKEVELSLVKDTNLNLVARSDNGNIGTLILSNGAVRGEGRTSLQLGKASNIDVQGLSLKGNFNLDTSANSSFKAVFDGNGQFSGSIKAKSIDVTFNRNSLFNTESIDTTPDAVIDFSGTGGNASNANPNNRKLRIDNANGTIELVGLTNKNKITGDGRILTISEGQTSLIGDIYTDNRVLLAFGAGWNADGLVGTNNTYYIRENGSSQTATIQAGNGSEIRLKGEGAVKVLSSAGTLASDSEKGILNLNVVAGKYGNDDDARSKITRVDLENLSSNITIKFGANGQSKPNNKVAANGVIGWGVNTVINSRGTNIDFGNQNIVGEHNPDKKTLIFANGTGTITTTNNKQLHELDGDNAVDKINQSSLTMNSAATSRIAFRNADWTFIGRTALQGKSHNIDGIRSTQGGNYQTTMGFYNTLIKDGDGILNVGNNNSTETKGQRFAHTDISTLRGTDVFNLSSVNSSINGDKGANQSSINAVFISEALNTLPEAQAIAIADTASSPKTVASMLGTATPDQALKDTLASQTTTNAGVLKTTQLEVLQSRAIGNITLSPDSATQVNGNDESVTATMKFIGEGSHTFNGKTMIKTESNSTKFYTYVGNGTSGGTNASDWKEITVSDSGTLQLNNISTENISGALSYKNFSQLSGGNANSRFDFDHTSVAPELLRLAGGKTLIYNSKVVGEIAVSNKQLSGTANGAIPANSSTTIFFNARMSKDAQETPIRNGEAEKYTEAAQKFIDYHFTSATTGLGINLDLSNAHQMVKANLKATTTTPPAENEQQTEQGSAQLTDAKTATYALGTTSKETNLVFIGKGSVNTENTTPVNNDGKGIDLSFLPTTLGADSKYNYTFISGGLIKDTDLKVTNENGEVIVDPSGAEVTKFGTSKVQLVDTYIVGERNFAQVGFINTNQLYNQISSWGGGEQIKQFLIFDMGGSKANKLNQNGSADVITNQSSSSRYIFSNLNINQPVEFKTDIKTTLNDAMSNVAPSTKQVIGNDVKGYLGFRGVSIQGDIQGDNGNGVDIVFNSTDNIAYKEWFDESGEHQAKIVEGEKNLVSHGTDYNKDEIPEISGYAVLKAGTSENANNGIVTIKGSAHKDITFIGENSVEGGFDKLKIQDGSDQSQYTFYQVGTLGNAFLQNVKLQYAPKATEKAGEDAGVSPDLNVGADNKANLGVMIFAGGTIINGDINADANVTSSAPVPERNGEATKAQLIFDDVHYSGTLSGTMIKDLKFGNQSNKIKIIDSTGGSTYDFSALAGKSIELDIDLTQTPALFDTGANQTFANSTIKGFENGDISLVGSLKFAKNSSEVGVGQENYSNSFAFNNDAKWTLTQDSRVMNLVLNNDGTSFNLDLSSAPRTEVAPQENAEAQETQKVVNPDLRVLEVGNLLSNGGQVLLGTQIDSNTQSNSKSDKIKASVLGDGTLYVTAKDAVLDKGTFLTSGDNAIVLVTADSAYGEVKGAERKEGLSYVSTQLEHQVKTDNGNPEWVDDSIENLLQATSHRWVLSGFDTKVNQELVDESGFLVSNPYRMLMIETNNLNKRMGDLRDNEYSQGTWIRVFNGRDKGEGSQNLYTNIQLGYDYGIGAIGAKNYTGVAFSTSIVDIDGNQYKGKANTYSLAVYDSYIADSGFYFDSIAKYLYTDQKVTPVGSSESSFGSHALSLGAEVGYRVYMGESNFYFESQAEVIAGLIIGVKDIDLGVIGGRNVVGELKTTQTINTRVGLVQGYSLKTQNGFRADFRVGVSLVNEFINEHNPVVLNDGITQAQTSIANDVKVVANVGTNLILTDQWRIYLDAEKSFGGIRNTDYQANVGARFSFGEKALPAAKPKEIAPLKLKTTQEDKK